MVQVSLSLLILCDTNLSWSSTYLLLFVLATYISSGGISLPSANRAALCSLSASRLALSVSKSQQSGPWQMTHPDKLQSYSLHPFYICLLSVTLIFHFSISLIIPFGDPIPKTPPPSRKIFLDLHDIYPTISPLSLWTSVPGFLIPYSFWSSVLLLYTPFNLPTLSGPLSLLPRFLFLLLSLRLKLLPPLLFLSLPLFIFFSFSLC